MTTEEFNIRIMPLRPELLSAARQGTTADQGAEDLVQETLLRLWDQRETLRRHPNPRALAFSTLRHLMHDHWRHRQLEREELPQRPERPYDDHGHEARSDLELISRIVDSLPPLQARIFRMKDIEGYEREEIRQILGCTDDSLRQNLSRARRTIRLRFEALTKSRNDDITI